jgi:hypothetical protein
MMELRAEARLDEAAPARAAEEAGSARRRAEAEPRHEIAPGGPHPPGRTPA